MSAEAAGPPRWSMRGQWWLAIGEGGLGGGRRLGEGVAVLLLLLGGDGCVCEVDDDVDGERCRQWLTVELKAAVMGRWRCSRWWCGSSSACGGATSAVVVDDGGCG
ncbi:hypothetical protein Dimus_013447 [Dionaea muscipula]